MEDAKTRRRIALGRCNLGSCSRSRVCVFNTLLRYQQTALNEDNREQSRHSEGIYSGCGGHSKICLMTREKRADSTGSALSVQAGSGGLGSFSPCLGTPSEILAAKKLRSPRDQDAGLPGNVNEGERLYG